MEALLNPIQYNLDKKDDRKKEAQEAEASAIATARAQEVDMKKTQAREDNSLAIAAQVASSGQAEGERGAFGIQDEDLKKKKETLGRG